MTDIQAGSILAAIQVTVMLSAMRAFYGCWPWEYNKTWYATKPRPAQPVPPAEPAPIADLVELITTDTFERKNIP